MFVGGGEWLSDVSCDRGGCVSEGYVIGYF